MNVRPSWIRKNSLYELWLGRIYGEKASRVGFLSAAGLAKKVRTSFERAVQLDPKNWEARVDLAEFYLQAPSWSAEARTRRARKRQRYFR